jgi:WD40 repeat protein
MRLIGNIFHFSTPEDVSMIMKFSSNAPIIHVSANTNSSLAIQAVVAISNKHDFSINRYNPNAGPSTQPYPDTSQTAVGQQTQLPLSMDTNLVSNINLNRRHLGDNFDERIQQRHQSFVVTADNRFIISTGYWDKSFRVQNTDMAKITQVLYGHFDIVTCVCRSEVTVAGNCFLATGSRDCTVCIWIWNGTKGAIVDREYPNQGLMDLMHQF